MNTGATGSGAINVYFVSQDLNNITVASTAGIAIGDTIEKVSGTGVLADDTTVGDVLDATTIQLSSITNISWSYCSKLCSTFW